MQTTTLDVLNRITELAGDGYVRAISGGYQ